MKKHTYVIIALSLLASFALGFYVYRSSDSETLVQGNITQKCPDDYGTDDAGSAEYLAAVNQWTNHFYDTHPSATLSDWSASRHQFWVDNNCTAALQRYQDAKDGKVDPVVMEQIDKELREATNNNALN